MTKHGKSSRAHPPTSSTSQPASAGGSCSSSRSQDATATTQGQAKRKAKRDHREHADKERRSKSEKKRQRTNAKPARSKAIPKLTDAIDDSAFEEYTDVPSLIDDYKIKYNHKATQALRALKRATEVQVADGFSYLQLKDGVSFFPDKPIGGDILFVRHFYPAYFARLRERQRAVLIGNPGISKSIFQAYYIYRCLQPVVPPNHKGRTVPPRVIVRQLGKSVFDIYCLEKRMVFSCNVDYRILRALDPETTEYLYEPVRKHSEPFFEDLALSIKASCSPDTRRYKEFSKNGGTKVYMPCWKEAELLMAGKVLREQSDATTNRFNNVDYTDETIRERFTRFGGIFRHVLPDSRETLEESISKQEQKLRSKKANALRVLAVLPIIEKESESDRTSPFLMQYDVDERTFKLPQLKIASVYVANQILNNLSTRDLAKAVKNLYEMFDAIQIQRYELFEIVVAESLKHKFWTWRIYENHLNTTMQYNEQSWTEHTFPVLKHVTIAAKDLQQFVELETDVLYRVVGDLQFPLVDMFYKTREIIDGQAADVLIGIQVTFAETHAKPESTIQSFYDKLRLPAGTPCKVLMVVAPKNVDKYAVKMPYQFVASPSRQDLSQAQKEQVLKNTNIQFATLKFERRTSWIAAQASSSSSTFHDDESDSEGESSSSKSKKAKKSKSKAKKKQTTTTKHKSHSESGDDESESMSSASAKSKSKKKSKSKLKKKSKSKAVLDDDDSHSKAASSTSKSSKKHKNKSKQR